MKRAAIILLAGLLTTSCARFSTVQTDISFEQGKPSRQITTRAAATTLLAGKSALANWKASQTDKSQGASVGSLTQDITQTQAIIEAMMRAALTVLTNK
jgi:hypothetical protein